jgi:dipeptidyl aminopeptidase/acylaminoacyl peptidase
MSYRCLLSLFLLATAALPVPTLARGQDAPQPLQHPTLDDLFKTAILGDLQVAPDGRSVLYTVRTADLEKNEWNTDVWLLTLPERARPEDVRLTRNPKSDTSPRWRPDGRQFAFLSVRPEPDGKEGKAALYLMDPRRGEPWKLYEHDTAIRAFRWSPDGTQIAFTAGDPAPADEKEKRAKGVDVSFQGEPGTYIHLWLLDVAGRKARRITGGKDFSVESFAFAPDGKTIAFGAVPTPETDDSWKSDVFVVAADTGATAKKLTDNPGPDHSPEFDPDGKFIYYHSVQTDRAPIGYEHMYRIPPAGGTPEDISPDIDVEASDYTFSRDGKAVYFEATTGTTPAIFWMPLATRKALRLSGDRGVQRDMSWSADRRMIALVEENPAKPPEIVAGGMPDKPGPGETKNGFALTHHNALAKDWAVGLTDVVRWKSADGRMIEGILVYPAGWSPARGRAPLIVKLHGGPSGDFVENFQAFYGSDAQRYAADGYVVLMPNPRGSAGYGDSTQRAVVKDWGGLDYQDIMIGVDTLIARGVAHPDSLGVMGWSYGGYMTAWTISQTNRFKAAVVGAGITEPIAMWGTQDIVGVFEAYFGGSPWDPGEWDVYQKSSPLAHLRNANTPTLIIQGKDDPRVPPNQAMLLYRSLKALGVATQLMWLPRTGHSPTEPGLQYETAKAQKDWMDRWIRGKKAGAADEVK